MIDIEQMKQQNSDWWLTHDDNEKAINKSRWDTIIAAILRIAHTAYYADGQHEVPSEDLVFCLKKYAIDKQKLGVKCPDGVFLSDDGSFHLEWQFNDGSRLALEFEEVRDRYVFGETMRAFDQGGQRQHKFDSWKFSIETPRVKYNLEANNLVTKTTGYKLFALAA